MKKFRKLTVGLLLLLSCVLMSACGKKFTCCECGDTVNSRPKVLSVYFSNGEYMFLNLEDIMGLQTFIFPEPVETEAVVIMIEEVYPGTLCEDTCITDVSFG